MAYTVINMVYILCTVILYITILSKTIMFEVIILSSGDIVNNETIPNIELIF